MFNSLTAIGYARTSGEINPEFSIPNQIQMIKDYCGKNNILLKNIFVDEKKSGTTTEGRDEYKELKKLIEKRAIDMVIVAFSDRLARESLEFVLILTEMKQNGIEFVSIGENLYGSKLSPLHIAMLGFQVETENRARAKRIRDSKDSSLKSGEYIYRDPYGYRKNEKNRFLEINSREADVVRNIYSLFLNGCGQTEIANLLNSDQSNTDKKIWTGASVRVILTNTIYVGVSDKPSLAHINFPSIISSEIFSKVQRKLGIDDPNRHQKNYQKHFHLLSKILICPSCHLPMSPSSQARSYFCKKSINHSCKTSSVKKEFIEPRVLEFLSLWERKRKHDERDRFEQKQHFEKQMNKLYKRKEELDKRFAVASIDLEAYRRKTSELNNELLQIKKGENILIYLKECRNSYASLINERKYEELRNQMLQDKIRVTFDKEYKIQLIQEQQ